MTLEDIYRRIPRIDCRQKCSGACGPIAMSREEAARIISALGAEPDHNGSLTCPVLCPHTGTCNAYDVRPLICRLWGTVDKMKCPFGCVPERFLTRAEQDAIFADYNKIAKKDHVMFGGL